MINNRGQSLDAKNLSRSYINAILGVKDTSNDILGTWVTRVKHEHMDVDVSDKQGGVCDVLSQHDPLVPSNALIDITGSLLDNSKGIISGCEGADCDIFKVDTCEVGGALGDGVSSINNIIDGVSSINNIIDSVSSINTVSDPGNTKGISIDIDIDMNMNDDSKYERFSQSSLSLSSSQMSPTAMHPSSLGLTSLGLTSLGLDNSIESAKSGFEDVEGGGEEDVEEGKGGGEEEVGSTRSVGVNVNINRHLNIRAAALPSFTGTIVDKYIYIL